MTKNIELLWIKLTEKRLHHPFHNPNIIPPINVTLKSKSTQKVMIPQIFWRKIHKICGSRITWISNENDSFLVQNTSKNINLFIFKCKNSSKQELIPIINFKKYSKMDFFTYFTYCTYTIKLISTVRTTTENKSHPDYKKHIWSRNVNQHYSKCKFGCNSPEGVTLFPNIVLWMLRPLFHLSMNYGVLCDLIMFITMVVKWKRELLQW